jgi:hypothetical protein
MSAYILRFVVLLLAALALTAAANAAPGDACAFHASSVSALFSAANAAGEGAAALAAGDRTAAAAALAAAAQETLAERARVAADAAAPFAKRERKVLLRTLRAAAKRARKAARAAERRSADAAARSATAASEAIAAALADAVAAHSSHSCVGIELRVPRLAVGASETRAVPGGSAVVADAGIEVLGTLAASGPGGLVLTAASGDVVLEGTVDARGTPPDLAGAISSAPAAPAPTARAARGFTSEPGCGDGQPLSITADTGNVRIGGAFFAYSGDGHDCAPALVDDATALAQDASFPDLWLARHGGNGGDLIVAAPSGAIRFAARRADDPGPFTTGQGGAGQDLRFTDAFVPPDGSPSLTRIYAGRGGDSGKLSLVAPEITLGGVRRLYGGGRGGDGGRLEWDARAGDALFPTALVALGVQGGAGGEGSVEGGRGGDLRYDGDRVVNAGEQPVTEVIGIGGAGGNLHAGVPRAADDELFAGDGGNAEVTGHHGWDGTAAHPDGAEGGRAVAGGGHGSLFDLPDHPNSIGGRGGDARARGGRGGDGRPSCSDPALEGGAGGAGGSVRAHGGSGGTAPAGRGGDGGWALLVETGAPGRGGNGLPTGSCGALATDHESLPGDGGEGFMLGAQGEAVEPLTAGCPDDFVACDEVPEEPEPDACARPRSFSSRVVEVIGSTTSGTSVTYDRRLDGSEPCSVGSCLARHVGSLTTTQVNGGGTRSETVTFDVEVESFLPSGAHLWQNFIDHCSPSGELHIGGSGGVDDLSDPATGFLHTITHTCGGFCACGSHWKACCPCPECRSGWKLDGDGVCD